MEILVHFCGYIIHPIKQILPVFFPYGSLHFHDFGEGPASFFTTYSPVESLANYERNILTLDWMMKPQYFPLSHTRILKKLY